MMRFLAPRVFIILIFGLGFIKAQLNETVFTGSVSDYNQALNDCLNTYLPDQWFFCSTDEAEFEDFLHGRFTDLEPELQKLFLLTLPYTNNTDAFELFSRADLSISVVLQFQDANEAVTDFLTNLLEDHQDEVCHGLLRTHYGIAVANVHSHAESSTVSIFSSVLFPTETPQYHRIEPQFYALPWKY